MTSSFVLDIHAEARALQSLAQDGSRRSQSELARALTRMFSRPEVFLGTGERAIVYDILGRLIARIETPAKRDVAAALAVQRDAPPGLTRVLAGEEIDIAFPVLAQSPTLGDPDIIDIIRTQSIEHQLAIVDRSALSEPVAAALAETGNQEVVVALLRNKAARISRKTMGDLVDQSRTVAPYRVPILDREDIESSLAMRMFFWVPPSLCERIIEKFSLEPQVIDELIRQLIGNEIRRVAEQRREAKAIAEELRTLMQREGRLNADMLMIALREGETGMFVSMFGKMTDLNEHMVGRILFEHDGKGLAVACRAAEIGRIAFVSIFALAQKMRAENDDVIHRRLPAALDAYDVFPRKAAAEVMAHWRRGMDYAGAIRTVEYKIRRG